MGTSVGVRVRDVKRGSAGTIGGSFGQL